MNLKNNETISVNRTYKDTLFCFLFREKSEALSLYNALNDTAHSDPDALEIVTLENVIYLSMKNDLAFVLDSSLNLYEHQSTYNPNMPLRNLFYVAKEYKSMIKGDALYSSQPVKLPYPKFIVFYNGLEKRPEKELLKLSDLYDASSELKENPELELKVMVLNINKGYNEGLKRKCPTLMEYMQYIDTVRYYSDIQHLNLADAVERAIDDCIQNGVLEKFLRKHRSEVFEMTLYECDMNAVMEMWKREASEEGHKTGIEEGLKAGREEGLKAGIQEGMYLKSISIILKTLKQIGDIPDNLEEQLKKLDDTTLDDLILFAPHAPSIEAFMDKLSKL